VAGWLVLVIIMPPRSPILQAETFQIFSLCVQPRAEHALRSEQFRTFEIETGQKPDWLAQKIPDPDQSPVQYSI
jgi:hypothetical protein